jgi:hypothetical protein
MGLARAQGSGNARGVRGGAVGSVAPSLETGPAAPGAPLELPERARFTPLAIASAARSRAAEALLAIIARAAPVGGRRELARFV